MAGSVSMICFVLCCVYAFVLFAVVTSNDNGAGYNVNSTAFLVHYSANKESLDSSAFAWAKPTDLDTSISNTNYNIIETTTQQAFNDKSLRVFGRPPTPVNDGVDGFYFPAPTLPLARNFDSLFTQFNRFVFSSPDNNDMSTYTPAVVHKFYQYGDVIMSTQVNGKRQIFFLPASSVSFECVDQNPAAFLVDRRNRCSRRVVLKQDCTSVQALNLDTYKNTMLFAAKNEDAAVVPVKMASVVLQSFDGIQNEVQIDENMRNMTPYVNSNMCSNVVLKVVYLVKYNMAGLIVNAGVHLLLGHFLIPALTLEQEFSVIFLQEKNKNVPVQNSGNPGYVIGRPILSGQVISKEKVVIINPGDTLSLLQGSANHNCLNGLHQHSPILFGVESMSGCTLRLEEAANCSLASQIILDVLRGQTYSQYVAIFGNSELDNYLDWVPIKHNYNHWGYSMCRSRSRQF
ncbi:tectonic-1 isoform X4 [Syngnathoides biaculeatus]|uniref:tectonic-1 isoform X4 n=1 Tax=Syngnathoides biaculeatus TaxID=300417 RepID=UPI002ADE45BF|nr:tectonic-1 isoform X4 [Syngnathoides biaculeatus]